MSSDGTTVRLSRRQIGPHHDVTSKPWITWDGHGQKMVHWIVSEILRVYVQELDGIGPFSDPVFPNSIPLDYFVIFLLTILEHCLKVMLKRL